MEELDGISRVSPLRSNRSSAEDPVDNVFLHPRNSLKKSKNHRVSYALVKSIVQNDSPDINTKLAEIEIGLQIDGNVKIVSQLEGNQEILSLSYTETYDHIAVGLTDGTIRLMNVKTGEFVSTLRDDEMVQNSGPTTAIKHRPVQKTHPISQTITATYATGCVKCWHYPTGRCLYTIRENRQTLGMAYHPNLPKFATVGDDACICIYDEETKTQERILQASTAPHFMNGHRSRVFAACFNPRSFHELISGGWDDTIQFWDTRQARASRHISGVHICGDSLDISKNGKEILSCAWSKDNAIQLWDYGSGKLILAMEPDSWDSFLYTGKYVGSCFIACGGCDNNLFRIIDLRSYTTIALIRGLRAGVYCLASGPLSSKRSRRIGLNESVNLPKIAFCCGRSVYEVEAIV